MRVFSLKAFLILLGIFANHVLVSAFAPVAKQIFVARKVISSEVFKKAEEIQRAISNNDLASEDDEAVSNILHESASPAMINPESLEEFPEHWSIAPTLNTPKPGALSSSLLSALVTNVHPDEKQEDLGNGVFITDDWRRAWYTYQSPPENPKLIDEKDGYAHYEIKDDDIEGCLPDDLVGVLYRNGPGKFGVNGERVAHVLDADGLIIKIHFPKPYGDSGKRKIMFTSKFILTKGFLEEQSANKFLYRGTFGTAPRGFDDRMFYNDNEKKNSANGEYAGLNSESPPTSTLSKIIGNAFKTNLKNPANTQVISYGGKLLALFEAGLPYRLDPKTLDTLGEDDMGGALGKDKLPVKVPSIPEEFTPSFLGGSAHTAHPNVCPKTGNLVGWHWSQIPSSKSLEITFTEWGTGFRKVASTTHLIPDCELAPHDMALTENYIVLLINALTMGQLPFLAGVKGPAASLSMDGRANVKACIFPRPTAPVAIQEKGPIYIDNVDPNFSIHFSHAYEEEKEETNGEKKIVAMFTGWPPNDSKDFLGAWGGFSPIFDVIPETFLWRLEIDLQATSPNNQHEIRLSIARGSMNVCTEHPLVHPNFNIRKAMNVYATASNLVGDSTAPTGYVRLSVEDGSSEPLTPGERNEDADAYWFGTRYFVGEPLVVPKDGGDMENEREAYLLGTVFDAVRNKSFVAVFDLEDRDLSEGPICKLWLKSGTPHGLHGCFALDDEGSSSLFC